MNTKFLKTIVISLIFIIALIVQVSAQTKRIDVRFPRGASSVSFNNTITGYGTADFRIRAGRGQNLFVKLDSKNNFMYFVIFKDSVAAGAFSDAAREVRVFSGNLSEGGTYIVRVYLVRAEARRNRRPVNFRLRFEVN